MSIYSTYNPLIGASTSETLYYVRCALFTLQDFAQYTSEKDGSEFSGASTIGLHYFLQCINEAIRYETEQRM